MPYTPVVSPDDKVIYSLCGTCGGLGFYGIERFMDETDRRDIEQLAAKGFIIRESTVKARVSSDDCTCAKPEVVNPVLSVKPSPPTTSSAKSKSKPVLSLSVRKRSQP
jgi:hypothetical protein